MRRSFRLGRVAGIDVGVHWSIVVIAALLAFGLADGVLPSAAPGHPATEYLAVSLAVAVLFFVCLFAHELSHALVARHFGVGVRSITLWLLGGVSELEDEPPSPRAELFIAGAGPLTSLVIGAAALAAAVVTGGTSLIVVSLLWLAGINVILGLFNLLPGAPLDGGRVVHAILWRIRGDRVSAQIAADRAGVALGFLLAALGVAEILFTGNLSGLWLVLLGWFLISAANAESADIRVHAALTGRTVRDIMATDLVCGYDTQTIDAFVENVAHRARHRTFPVVDLNGQLVGMVRLADLARVAPEARATHRLRDALTPAAGLTAVAPDDPAADAATALTPSNQLVPVVDAGRLVGVVSVGDLAHAVELSTLLSPRPPAPVRGD